MNKIIKVAYLIFCTLLVNTSSILAQDSVTTLDTLTYDQCVQLALENNYGILISKNKQEIATNNATIGNADLLPKLSVNGGLNGSLNDVNQQFITEDEKTRIKGARSTSQNANLSLNYNIYQGNTRINYLKNLRIQSAMSELDTKNKIEETMLLIGQNYYQIAGIQANLNLQKDVLDVSKSRYERTKYKYEYGDALKIDVLNAEVNLNSDSLNFLTAQRNLTQAKRELMILISQDPSKKYAVSTHVDFIGDLDRETIKSELKSNNTLLLLADNKITQAQYNLAISRGKRMPILTSNLGYGWNASQSDAGILASNSVRGISGGLTLSFDIFDGNKKNIAMQNSAIQVNNSEKDRADQQLKLMKDLENSWSEYTFQLSVIRLQKRNISTNKLNFERSEELFGFGQLTSTQFREAQINYLTARYNLILSTATAKIEEIRMLRLSGQLID